MAFAQDEGQGAAANMQGGEIGEYQHHLGYSIEGSWIFDIDVLGQGTPFHSLISFAAGRVVITSASLPGPASSPFYGSWRPTETNRVQAAFFAFVPDATGVGVALSKVSLNLKVTSRNALTGTAVGANCDLQGESCVQTGEFQFTGKRITPE
jgi:hypothetical protein